MAEITVYYDGPIVTKAEAKTQGLTHWFSGKPCKHGHVDKRFTSTGQCFRCLTLHYEKWRKDNRDKVSAATLAWMKANPEQRKEIKRAYHHRNKVAINAQRRQQRQENPTKARQRDVERYPRIRERVIKRAAAWAKANPESRATTRGKRRGAVGRIEKGEIEQLLIKQCWKCANCGKSIRWRRHVDHIVPIAKGGQNVISNVQLLCPTCNHKKSAKDPFEFAREQGRLL